DCSCTRSPRGCQRHLRSHNRPGCGLQPPAHNRAGCGYAESGADLEQLYLEDQLGVGRDDAAGAARPVTECRRDDELALAADLHAGHALVPALDDHAGAELERERLVAVVAAVELLAVAEPAGVVDLDRV